MTEQVEDKKRKAILAKVRAMMERTVANGCTEQEANQAAAMVDRLMSEYEIDLSETLVADQEVVRFDIALGAHPVRWAAVKLAEFCDCKVWTDSVAGEKVISFVGLEIDTQIAEYLVLLFRRAIDRETTQFSQFNAEMAMMDGRGQRDMVHSFQNGMASRLGHRLRELKSKRDFAQKATGFDLVLAKKPLVDEAFNSLGLDLHMERGARIGHMGAYAAGQGAADKVSITQGVTGRGTSNGRIR